MQKILETAVRVIWVEEDAEWKAEFEEYGYDTDMWATYGDGDVWRNNVVQTEMLCSTLQNVLLLLHTF